jgi:endonuclease/exonuclease/phosphatase family metal-dependent hydrolase
MTTSSGTQRLSLGLGLGLALCIACGPSTRSDVETTADVATEGQFSTASQWNPYSFLTLNLHCLKTGGSAFWNNADRFAMVARAVNEQDVAVIAAQEVCRREGEDVERDLRQALERATGRRWSSYWLNAHTAWHGTPDEADEGLAIFVRGDFDLSKVLTYQYYAQNDLKRVMLGVKLPPELGGLRIFTVHLSVEKWQLRAAQARETAAVALSAVWPEMDTIVAGDFNDRPGTAPLEAMRSQGYRDVTDGLSGNQHIDHIFKHRASWVSTWDAKAIFDGTNYPRVSDHEGYVVRVGPGVGDTVRPVELLADIDVGWGNHLAVRGGTFPLSWGQGLVAYPARGNQWRFVTTELPSAGADVKWMLNDARWQLGGNARVTAGTQSRSSPRF